MLDGQANYRKICRKPRTVTVTSDGAMDFITNDWNISVPLFYGQRQSFYDGVITGTAAREPIFGTPGNNLMFGSGGSDIIIGLDGNDCIYG